MAAFKTRREVPELGLDNTMRDELVLDSGDESDTMDNIVFRRPVTRGSSKAAGSAAGSTSTPPARRRSPRKSSTISRPKRPSSSRRVSQVTSSPSSSASQPSEPPSLAQSQSQSDPSANEEPTGMSQDMAGVSVAAAVRAEPTDVRMASTEPQLGDFAPVPASMDLDTHSRPNSDAISVSDTADPQPDSSVAGPSTGARTAAPALVFETEPGLASTAGSQSVSARDPKPSRALLALPVFAITTSPADASAEDDPSLAVSDIESTPPLPGSHTFDSNLSIGNMSSDCDVPPIPASFAPRRTHTPRRSSRLSGNATAILDVSSSSASLNTVHTTTVKTFPSHATRRTKKTKAKSPTRDGPSLALHDVLTNNTTSKGKEKEHVLPVPPSPPPTSSPPPIPPANTTQTDTLKPPELRSLSPASDAVLMSLHRTLTPQPRPALKHLPKSAERPPAPPSAMKRRAEEMELTSPGKRARFNPDPQPPPPPPIPKPNLARPSRIRVHPSNSLLGMAHKAQTGSVTQQSSFLGSHPPITVRPSGSPSRQQMLLQRPVGPPMRVPVNQPQRIVFPARVPSPIRTGSQNGAVARNPSPFKAQRRTDGGGLVWQRPPGSAIPNRGIPPTSQNKPDVVTAPRDEVRSPPERSLSPGRVARSRLPVLKYSGGSRATMAKAGNNESISHESGIPPAVGNRPMAEASAGLQVPSTVCRERTPPTPLESPGSPGSSSSTLIMDVPLFYQPPAPRLPPIQQRTAEEIIAEGTAREAQRKRERQGQGQGQSKSAAAAAAALRCLPLARARRIIPDGSSLQSWPSVSGPMSVSEKEMQRLTKENTERNTAYVCTLERTEAFKDAPRPPSPTSRIRTKAQKAKEMEKMERAERAQRRSASRGGDTSVGEVSELVTSEEGHVLAPGDDEVYESPVRAGRRVRWQRTLVQDDVGPGAGSAAGGVGKGCLARTYELDRHGNVQTTGETVEGERVVVVRYVYRQ